VSEPMVMKMPRAQRRPRVVVLRRVSAPRGCGSTGPQWGSAINVLNRLLAAGRLALHPVTQKVGKDHVVPAAGWANFDDHDLKLPELVCHLFQLSGLLDAPRILSQLIAEHVLQIDQFIGVTHWTIDARGLSVVLRRSEQHRIRVAGLLPCKPASRAPQRLKCGASLQRVVDDFALGPHGQQRTWSRPGGRPRAIFYRITPERELLVED